MSRGAVHINHAPGTPAAPLDPRGVLQKNEDSREPNPLLKQKDSRRQQHHSKQRTKIAKLGVYAVCKRLKLSKLLSLIPSLELRHLHFDLAWAYKIIFDYVDVRSDDNRSHIPTSCLTRTTNNNKND